MLESGIVSLKNEVNIMMKNVVDVVLGGLTYWAFGYSLSYGESSYSNPFISFGSYFVGEDTVIFWLHYLCTIKYRKFGFPYLMSRYVFEKSGFRYQEIWEKSLSIFFFNYRLLQLQPLLYRARWRKGILEYLILITGISKCVPNMTSTSK